MREIEERTERGERKDLSERHVPEKEKINKKMSQFATVCCY